MPELPEVETVAKQLDEVLKGKKVEEIEILKERSFSGNEKELKGKEIKRVWRKSKLVIVEFDDEEYYLVCHLKMTGQLIYDDKQTIGEESHTIVGGHPSEDWIKKHPTKHTRIVIIFDDKSVLYFNDLRIFGWMKMILKREFVEIMKHLPPDVVDKEFTLEYFKDVIKKSGRAIKLVVMDSNKIGGAGNIYANDALHSAGIDPRKSANKLNSEEAEKLYWAIKEVIEKGIRYGGASASNYVHISGKGGQYQDYFLVYQRDGQKCDRCGGKIEKIKLGGRGTFFCSGCQK